MSGQTAVACPVPDGVAPLRGGRYRIVDGVLHEIVGMASGRRILKTWPGSARCLPEEVVDGVCPPLEQVWATSEEGGVSCAIRPVERYRSLVASLDPHDASEAYRVSTCTGGGAAVEPDGIARVRIPRGVACEVLVIGPEGMGHALVEAGEDEVVQTIRMRTLTEYEALSSSAELGDLAFASVEQAESDIDLALADPELSEPARRVLLELALEEQQLHDRILHSVDASGEPP